MPAQANRVLKKALVGLASLGAGVYALYRYQPQRYFFFPKPVPEPNPRVDPAWAKLFAKGTRVAIVVAHPDDPEFYIGGLLTKLHRTGAEIEIVMCTNGDKGYYPKFLRNENANSAVRRDEQLEAAANYGAIVHFLGELDGRLRADPETVLKAVKVLQTFQPEYILSFDYLFPPQLQHNDHLEAGRIASRASLAVSSVQWLLRFGTRAPNFFVDVTGLWKEKKRLLQIHRSQFHGKRLAFVMSMVEGRAKEDGERFGVAMAEAFRCVRLGPR